MTNDPRQSQFRECAPLPGPIPGHYICEASDGYEQICDKPATHDDTHEVDGNAITWRFCCDHGDCPASKREPKLARQHLPGCNYEKDNAATLCTCRWIEPELPTGKDAADELARISEACGLYREPSASGLQVTPDPTEPSALAGSRTEPRTPELDPPVDFGRAHKAMAVMQEEDMRPPEPRLADDRYRRALQRIADMSLESRPDGTYNYDRAALIYIARDALKEGEFAE